MDLTDNAIEAPQLKKLSGLRHAFFTRQGGTSSGLYESLNIGIGSDDDREKVIENRARCARHLGVTENQLATPYQIHSPDALIIDTPFADSERPKADAFVTKQAGLALGIATADCGPVLFADEDAGVIGAAHAGWRGATAGILSNTINAMVSLGAVPSKITAVLGPTIRQKSYEVGPEFVDNLTALSPANTTYLVPSKQDGHAMFDLPRFIVDHLKALNIGTVAELGLDTYEDEKRFFSYRRTTHRSEGDYGRLLSAIVLTP